MRLKSANSIDGDKFQLCSSPPLTSDQNNFFSISIVAQKSRVSIFYHLVYIFYCTFIFVSRVLVGARALVQVRVLR